jgi:dipeptidase E
MTARTSRARQIIALGGTSSVPRYREALFRYILRQTGARKPRICLLATASGDAQSNIRRFHREVESLGAIVTHHSLFDSQAADPQKLLLEQDAIFVGGGNTRNMLALWKLWGIDVIVRAAYRRGIVLAGTSAGALCWFQSGLTDSFPRRLAALACLGYLKGSFCPHYDSEPKRRPIYRKLIREGRLPAGYGVEDGVALHFKDGQLWKAVRSIRTATACLVRRVRGSVVEERLPQIEDIRR